MNDFKPTKEPILLYTCKCDMEYGSGMIVVTAKNAFNAMTIIYAHNHYPFLDQNLEQIVGATYIGKEQVIAYQMYIE